MTLDARGSMLLLLQNNTPLLNEQHGSNKAHHEQPKHVGQNPKASKSVFDVMIDMAQVCHDIADPTAVLLDDILHISIHELPLQEPALLVLFYPYLPKDRRTHAALVKAMQIESWRKQILTGESQV